MNTQKIVSLAALILMLVGGTIIGINRAHAQTPTMQNQAVQTVFGNETKDDKLNASGKEGVEAVESANEQAQDKHLPGGGHQDTGGNVDHQFEGVE